MPHCPFCETDVETPHPETIVLDEFLVGIDVEVSVEQLVQLECPDCESVLGYLGVAAAIGGEHTPGFQ